MYVHMSENVFDNYTSMTLWHSCLDAMVSFYLALQKCFISDIQTHYVYSPCKLTRWVWGVYEEVLFMERLVHIWAHEALHLFQNYFITKEEKQWTDKHIDLTATPL